MSVSGIGQFAGCGAPVPLSASEGLYPAYLLMGFWRARILIFPSLKNRAPQLLKRCGDYELEGIIAPSGMGLVFRAHQATAFDEVQVHARASSPGELTSIDWFPDGTLLLTSVPGSYVRPWKMPARELQKSIPLKNVHQGVFTAGGKKSSPPRTIMACRYRTVKSASMKLPRAPQRNACRRLFLFCPDRSACSHGRGEGAGVFTRRVPPLLLERRP